MTDRSNAGKRDDAARRHVSEVQPYGWDWSATTHEAYDGVVDDLLLALGAEHVTFGKGLQGWSQSVQAFDAGGYRTGAVYFGGGRDDVHVLSTSSQAHDARARVARLAGALTARVDTRVDTDALTFGELRRVCEEVAGPRTNVTYYESKKGGKSTGRTLMIGAPTSAVRVRVYEKWLESPGQYAEGVNRVEVQLRPPSRAKAKVSGWTPEETFCASKLTRRLASELGGVLAAPGSLQKSKGTPDLERALRAMADQYGPSVRRWLSLSGGDLGKVLDYLEGERGDSCAAPEVLRRRPGRDGD